jgi:prophage regulatory protein
MLESFAANEKLQSAKSPLWRISQVCTVTGLSRSQILRMVKQGKFPQPVRPTERQPYWFASDVDDWQTQLAGLRDRAPPAPGAAADAAPDPPAPRRRGRPPGSAKK